MGTVIDIPTVYGEASLTIPAGTQSGTKFLLRGQGVKGVNGEQGHQYVQIKIVIPSSLSPEIRELYQRLSALQESPYQQFQKEFRK